MAPWPIPWFFNLIFSRCSDEDCDGDDIVLALPDSTRRFVSRLKLPPDRSIRGSGSSSSRARNSGCVYILAVEALSERSATDAAALVRAAKPGAVVAQVAAGALPGLNSESHEACSPSSSSSSSSNSSRDSGDRVPTNSLGVIAACFWDSTKRSSFESRAGIEVLKTIFGTTFHGHVVSAKNAAKDANSAFLYLETPELGSPAAAPTLETTSKTSSSFAADSTSSSGGVASRLHRSLLQSLSTGTTSGFAEARFIQQEQRQQEQAECPTYAAPFYPLLVDLQEAYRSLPGMNQALQNARRLLFDVEQGRQVDHKALAEAQNFRLAVEGLRIALCKKRPQETNQRQLFRKPPPQQKFEDLTLEDQTFVLLAQALQDQCKTHGSVVAVMEASSVAGIRRHWNTPVSAEVIDRARKFFIFSELGNDSGGSSSSGAEMKLVGSGSAVAAVGIAALPWWAPATPFTKVIVLKAPAFLKIAFLHLKRNAGVVIGKSFAPLMAPGKSFSAIVKSAASAGKARAAAQSVVASAERATFSATRTAFYCVMRKKQGMSAGGMGGAWVVLGTSVAAGGGILWWRDRLEAAIEAVPGAATVARLGRGLEALESAAKRVESARKHKQDLYRNLGF